MQEIADALRGTDVGAGEKPPSAPTSSCGSAPSSASTTPASAASEPSTAGSSIDKSLYRNPDVGHSHRAAPPSPRLPIFCDPSHIGGKRELIAPLSQQAMDLGFDGLIIEAHCSPDCAWSDKAQQVTPEALAYIIRNLIRDESITTESSPGTAFADRQARRPAWSCSRAACASRATSQYAQHWQTQREGAARADGHGPRVHAHRPAGHPRGVDPPADGGAGDFPACSRRHPARPPARLKSA